MSTSTNAQQFEFIKQVGKTQIATTQSSLANRGGFYCEACDVLLKDSRSFMMHQNGRKHLKKAGQGIFARRVKHPEVEEVLNKLQVHHIQQNPHLIQYEFNDMEDVGTKAPVGILVTVLHNLLQTQYDLDNDNNEENNNQIDNENMCYDQDHTSNTKKQRTSATQNSQQNVSLTSNNFSSSNEINGLESFGDDNHHYNSYNTDNSPYQHENTNENSPTPQFSNYDMWSNTNDYFSIPNRNHLIIPPLHRYGNAADNHSDDDDEHHDDDDDDGGFISEEQRLAHEAALLEFEDDFNPWGDDENDDVFGPVHHGTTMNDGRKKVQCSSDESKKISIQGTEGFPPTITQSHNYNSIDMPHNGYDDNNNHNIQRDELNHQQPQSSRQIVFVDDDDDDDWTDDEEEGEDKRDEGQVTISFDTNPVPGVDLQ